MRNPHAEAQFGFQIERDEKSSGLNSRPEHIKEVAEASLRRLKVDSIDLFYQHRAASQITVQGARYPEQLERMTGR